MKLPWNISVWTAEGRKAVLPEVPWRKLSHLINLRHISDTTNNLQCSFQFCCLIDIYSERISFLFFADVGIKSYCPDEVYRFLQIWSDTITANRGVSRYIRYFILFATGVTKLIMYLLLEIIPIRCNKSHINHHQALLLSEIFYSSLILQDEALFCGQKVAGRQTII
jgi:hypothetical protein